MAGWRPRVVPLDSASVPVPKRCFLLSTFELPIYRDPTIERRCHSLIVLSMVHLTIGIGYNFVTGTKLADFLVTIAGLFIGWVGLIYCVSNTSLWR